MIALAPPPPAPTDGHEDPTDPAPAVDLTAPRGTAPGAADGPSGAARPVEVLLREFIEQDYSAVVAAVGLITNDRLGAEDAVQDALVKLLTRPPTEPLRSVAAWVTVVASNEARTGQRRRGAEERALGRLAGRAGPQDDEIPAAVLEAGRVMEAVETLPIRQRQIAVMHYYLDSAVVDIAAALDVTEGTVKTQLHRARTALADRLGTDDDTGPAATDDGDGPADATGVAP